MTEMVDFDIVGSYNNQRISNIDAERSINLFEYIDPLGKKPRTLIDTSGLTNSNFTFTGTTGGFRVQYVFRGVHYFVIGNAFYSQTTANVITKLGTLNSGSGYVGIDANTFQIILVDGINGYIYDTTAPNLGLKVIVDTAFPPLPLDVCALDGFFVVIQGNTNNFFLSSFNQGMVWGPAANNYSASAVTNLLTVGASTIGGTSGTVNYPTGAAVTLTGPTSGDTFTTNYGASHFNLTLVSTTNYPTGVPIKFTNTGGSLPSNLNSTTVYFAINVNATTIKVASTYANAIGNVSLDIGSDQSGTSTVTGQIPQPLNNTTTYFVINVSGTTIQLASTLANAQAGTAITLTSAGGPNNVITSTGQLQQGQVTSHPGTLVACRTLHRRLFLFSQFFTEVWENQGIGANLPFRRNNSLLIEYGCAAIGSIDVSFDMMMFLSQDREGLGAVMQVLGAQPLPASTRALDFQLSQYASTPNQGISDCRGFLVKENGLIFYRMNFTAANNTFVYNVTQSIPGENDATKYWHEEQTLVGNRNPAQTHAYFNNLNYVGDYQNPILYILDSSNYTNNGEIIPRIRISKAIVNPGYQRRRIDRFHLDIVQGDISELLETTQNLILQTEALFDIDDESGNPLLLEQGLNIQSPEALGVYLSISKDGGVSYGYRQFAPMGNAGQRTFRTVWRKLGVVPRGQAFVCKIEFYGQSQFTILGAAWASEVMPQ